MVKAAKHKPLTSGKRRFIVADPVSIIGALEAPLLAINRIPTFSKAHFASKVADLGPPLGRQQPICHRGLKTLRPKVGPNPDRSA